MTNDIVLYLKRMLITEPQYGRRQTEVNAADIEDGSKRVLSGAVCARREVPQGVHLVKNVPLQRRKARRLPQFDQPDVGLLEVAVEPSTLAVASG